MDYEQSTIERVIDRAVRPNEGCVPTFYAVTGSHIYGFPSEEGGDVDVRGFHVADGERYTLLDEPAEQFIVNQDGVTEGFEDYAHVDLVSYELKKFGRLVYQANFNVLEVIFCGEPVINGAPLEVRALCSLVEDHLPLDVPRTYLGMARNNYRKYLDPNREGYTPSAKKFLYVLRGLLASQYVLEEATIEADVRALSAYVLGETDLVDELIAVKLEGESATVSPELAARADDRIAELFNAVDPPEVVEKDDFRAAIDEWMLKVRR